MSLLTNWDGLMKNSDIIQKMVEILRDQIQDTCDASGILSPNINGGVILHIMRGTMPVSVSVGTLGRVCITDGQGGYETIGDISEPNSMDWIITEVVRRFACGA